MVLMNSFRSILKYLVPPFTITRRPRSQVAKRNMPHRLRLRMAEQPSTGNLRGLHPSDTSMSSCIVGDTVPEPQASLDRKRRHFIATLPKDHALRSRVFANTGELLPLAQQPPGKAREFDCTPEEVQLRRRHRKPRDDTDSAQYSLERRRFVAMWNGISERSTREEEWLEFDQVKSKLLCVKRKHHFLDQDLEDESTLERKRAKSRRRSSEKERRMRNLSATTSIRNWRSMCTASFFHPSNNVGRVSEVDKGSLTPTENMVQEPMQERHQEQDFADTTFLEDGSSMSWSSVPEPNAIVENDGIPQIGQFNGDILSESSHFRYFGANPSGLISQSTYGDDSDTIMSNLIPSPRSPPPSAQQTHQLRQPWCPSISTFDTFIDPRLRNL